MNELRKRDASIKRRTYTVLVENEPGVLARISGLFSARGFNIASLAVGETEDPTVSRMTLVADGTDIQLEQVNKQLNKLVPVIGVRDLHEGEYVSRELMLVKLNKTSEVLGYVKKSNPGRHLEVIDESPEHYIVQAVVSGEDSPKLLEDLKKLGLAEISRTGQVALSKKYKVGIHSS